MLALPQAGSYFVTYQLLCSSPKVFLFHFYFSCKLTSFFFFSLERDGPCPGISFSQKSPFPSLLLRVRPSLGENEWEELIPLSCGTLIPWNSTAVSEMQAAVGLCSLGSGVVQRGFCEHNLSLRSLVVFWKIHAIKTFRIHTIFVLF